MRVVGTNGKTTIDLLIEPVNERNKPYYVVGLDQKWACFKGIRQEGIGLKRLMEWAWNAPWKSYDNDLNWYNADGDEFMNAQEMVDDFHTKYSRKAH